MDTQQKLSTFAYQIRYVFPLNREDVYRED